MIITVNEKQVNALVELRDQIRGELEAVEATLAIASRRLAANGGAPAAGNAVPVPVPQLVKAKTGKREYGAVTKAVLEAIALCPAEFQFAHVEKALVESLKHPLKQEQISLAINRLIKQAKIEVNKPRYGRTPAIYKKM
jgi:hypothetical protein